MIPKAFVEGHIMLAGRFNSFFKDCSMEIIKIDVAGDTQDFTKICVVAYYEETQDKRSYELVVTRPCNNNSVAG